MTQRRTLRRTVLRRALALTAAAVGTASTAGQVLASDTWCDVDPVQLVVTSGGKIVPIFVTNGAPSPLYAPQLLLAAISHTVRSVDGGAASLVTVSVTVPNAPLGQSFPARSVVTSGPAGTLHVYASATGTSGRAMTMQFKLPVG